MFHNNNNNNNNNNKSKDKCSTIKSKNKNDWYNITALNSVYFLLYDQIINNVYERRYIWMYKYILIYFYIKINIDNRYLDVDM